MMTCLENPRTMRRFHAAATLFWLGAIVPTLLWWRESVLWVALMSLWANVASHWACWQAVKAEEATKPEQTGPI